MVDPAQGALYRNLDHPVTSCEGRERERRRGGPVNAGASVLVFVLGSAIRRGNKRQRVERRPSRKLSSRKNRGGVVGIGGCCVQSPAQFGKKSINDCGGVGDRVEAKRPPPSRQSLRSGGSFVGRSMEFPHSAASHRFLHRGRRLRWTGTAPMDT